jgi:hypothetical protein
MTTELLRSCEQFHRPRQLHLLRLIGGCPAPSLIAAAFHLQAGPAPAGRRRATVRSSRVGWLESIVLPNQIKQTDCNRKRIVDAACVHSNRAGIESITFAKNPRLSKSIVNTVRIIVDRRYTVSAVIAAVVGRFISI